MSDTSTFQESVISAGSVNEEHEHEHEEEEQGQITYDPNQMTYGELCTHVEVRALQASVRMRELNARFEYAGFRVRRCLLKARILREQGQAGSGRFSRRKYAKLMRASSRWLRKLEIARIVFRRWCSANVIDHHLTM